MPPLRHSRHPERAPSQIVSSRPSAKRSGGTCSSPRLTRKGVPHPFVHFAKGWEPQLYAVILSEAPSQICHPDQARSAQWRDLQFASVGTKKGCPILSRTLRKGGNHNSALSS